jgi:hypothetical protein
MKLVKSKQKDVPFVWCPSPLTLDKRQSWGNDSSNLQIAPDGAFLKMNGNVVSHLVQPNADKTAPIGWIPGSGEGLFDKEPIWVESEVCHSEGSVVELNTLDGPLTYTVESSSYVCFNDLNGSPNLSDSWLQTEENLRKSYEF